MRASDAKRVAPKSTSRPMGVREVFRTKVRIEKVRMAIIRKIKFVWLKYVRIKYVGYKVRHVKSS